MNDPRLFTEPASWDAQYQVQDVLAHVHNGSSVGLVMSSRGDSDGVRPSPGETLELFAVIVPIEQYRRMTDGSGK